MCFLHLITFVSYKIPCCGTLQPKLLHERQVSVTDKDDRDFGLHIQPQTKIFKKDHSIGNDSVGSWDFITRYSRINYYSKSGPRKVTYSNLFEDFKLLHNFWMSCVFLTIPDFLRGWETTCLLKLWLFRPSFPTISWKSHMQTKTSSLPSFLISPGLLT